VSWCVPAASPGMGSYTFGITVTVYSIRASAKGNDCMRPHRDERTRTIVLVTAQSRAAPVPIQTGITPGVLICP
jgi:hypothetical protein